jgi:hypothetical protein
MTYRNDSDALLARNDALEREVRRLRALLSTPTQSQPAGPLQMVPPPEQVWPFAVAPLSPAARREHELAAARMELEYLLEDRRTRARGSAVFRWLLGAAAFGALPLPFTYGAFPQMTAFCIVVGLSMLVAAICIATGLAKVGEGSWIHAERIAQLRS